MRSSAWSVAALAMALGLASGAHGQSNVYKWTDSQGKVHFSDTPPNEPAKNVMQKRMGGGTVDVSQLPYATQLAMKNHPVTLYTAPQCGDPCANGRTLLADRGIPYTERDAQANPADAEAVKKLVGALRVPVLLVGSETMKGYDANAWQAALDGAGYPRTKLPGTLTPRPQVAPAPPPPPAASGEAAPSQEAPAASPPGK